MEYVIGALLLASFFGLAVYAVRGGNLMIGMLIIGTLWTVLPLFGNTFATNPDFIAAYPGVTDISFVDAITKVYQSGPEGWGSVLVNVVFGAWFGRVLLETGIADALIRKTVELGGDKPIVISVLLSIVTTAIFSTLFGAGAVVAIGVIILPILMSLGIPKVLAVGSFMMSVGAGMYLNPVLSGQFLAFFLDENGKQLITYDDPARLRWAVIGMLVQLGMVIVMTAVSLRKEKNRPRLGSLRGPPRPPRLCADQGADCPHPAGPAAGHLQGAHHPRLHPRQPVRYAGLRQDEILPRRMPYHQQGLLRRRC